MQIEIHGDEAAAAEILALVESWDDALRSLDAEALTADYSETPRIFDIGAQIGSRDDYREHWRACLPWFGERAWIERRAMQLFATSELAFLCGYTRVGGDRSPPPAETPWLRVTVCYRRIDGAWRAVHEHASMPFDFEAGAPLPILGDPE